MAEAEPPAGQQEEKGLLRSLGLHRKELRAWALYDWANSAFATTIMAAVLPIYYSTVAASTIPQENLRTAYWGYTTSFALLLVAVISPILGAAADYLGAKKRFLGAFVGLGVSATALLFFVRTGDWLFASAVFVLGNVGFSGANVFYESLLPHVASSKEIDRVSTAGYAIGYLGGGLLLALNFAWITFPETFGMDGRAEASRWAFLSVAAWWLLFSIPLFKRVGEPPRQLEPKEGLGINPVRVGFARVRETLKELRRHRQVFLFLLAFWFYNDGIGTIIKMGASYGTEIGIPQGHLLGTLLMIQFVGIPFAFLFGALADRIGAKRGIYICLTVYAGCSIFGYFMTEAWQFWLLGFGIATVQGGSQGLSRSLFASIVPRGKSSEFFGFYSVSAKFAGILGPLAFGAVSTVTGSSRNAILFLIVFFLGGILFLSFVDEEEGRRAAAEEDAEMVRAAAAR